MANFLSYPIFQDIVLPFILVFALVFAILQKSKLLGEGKQQIDAIIAFVIAGILVAFSTQVLWLRHFTVFLVIGLFILFVFMLIYGFAYGDTKGDPLAGEKWVKPTIGIISFVAVIIAAVVITGYWDKVLDFFKNNELGANIIFVVLIIVAILVVLKTGGSGKKE
jgi:peptidoglycan/LPS O-acetylase OafA/YrhL